MAKIGECRPLPECPVAADVVRRRWSRDARSNGAGKAFVAVFGLMFADPSIAADNVGFETGVPTNPKGAWLSIEEFPDGDDYDYEEAMISLIEPHSDEEDGYHFPDEVEESNEDETTEETTEDESDEYDEYENAAPRKHREHGAKGWVTQTCPKSTRRVQSRVLESRVDEDRDIKHLLRPQPPGERQYRRKQYRRGPHWATRLPRGVVLHQEVDVPVPPAPDERTAEFQALTDRGFTPEAAMAMVLATDIEDGLREALHKP